MPRRSRDSRRRSLRLHRLPRPGELSPFLWRSHHIYAALFALALIALAVVGSFLAVRDGDAWVIPFLLARGVLGVMLLRVPIGA